MKTLRKTLAMILVLSMVFCLAIGSVSASAEEKTKLRLLTWGNTAEEQITKDAVARFNEQYPDVEVEITIIPVDDWTDFIAKWSTMITSGEAPDVISFAVEAFPMAVANNLVMPLDDIAANTPELNIDSYAKSLRDGFSANGSLYGIPNGTQTMVIYYNKDMLAKAGLEAPQDGWTWDDFYSYAKALTADGVYGFGMPSTYFQLSPWFSTNGTQPATADLSAPAVNSEEMIESVTFIDKIVKDGLSPDPISSDVYTMFANCEVAMVGAGRWCLNSWMEAGLNNDNFDCVQFPVSGTDSSSVSSIYGGSAYGISASTENVEMATELLVALCAEETQIATAAGGQQIPPSEALALNPEIMGTTPDNIDGLWVSIANGVSCCCPEFYGDLCTALSNAMEKIWSGSMSVEDALNEAQTIVEEAIS